MKTEIETEFTPIKVTLILETREDAEAFYNIINHHDILGAAGLDFGEIRDALGQYKNNDSFSKFCQYLEEHV